MIVQPKIRGFICTTAHPQGCAQNVRDMVRLAQQKQLNVSKKTLILGASTGYGLASMVTAAFGCGAKTIGVSFDKPAVVEKKRTATAGWYNMAAFAQEANKAGLEHYGVIGDAYSDECKKAVIRLIREHFGKVDTVIYSLASPVRIDAKTKERYNSVLKPVGQRYTSKSIDQRNWQLEEVTLEPATQEEIDATVKVMGGEDWQCWMDALAAAGVLESDFLTIAYSYIGPSITYPIYTDGTIGQAKKDLQNTADKLDCKGRGFVSVNKAVVTQASAAIPAVPLYIALLFKEMKARGLHEDCIEQMLRMFEKLDGEGLELDEQMRIRMDDWEMREDVQSAVLNNWENVTNDTLHSLADIQGYQNDFAKLFGFGHDDVDYDQDVDPCVEIAGATIL